MEIVDGHMHLWTPETHPWVDKVKDGGHPAGPFGMITYCIYKIYSLIFLASVIPYTLKEYVNDIAGYNVTHAVHVEACWPGDPVGETK